MINFGTAPLSNIMLGDNIVNRIYKGDELLYTQDSFVPIIILGEYNGLVYITSDMGQSYTTADANNGNAAMWTDAHVNQSLGTSYIVRDSANQNTTDIRVYRSLNTINYTNISSINTQYRMSCIKAGTDDVNVIAGAYTFNTFSAPPAVWKSSNSGGTFTTIDTISTNTSRIYTSAVAFTDNLSKIAITAGNAGSFSPDGFYQSIDGGATWVRSDSSFSLCLGTDMSNDGNYVYFTSVSFSSLNVVRRSVNGAAYTTVWSATLPGTTINKISCSADGQYVIFCVGTASHINGTYVGRIYISSNYGITFTESRPAGDANYNWHNVKICKNSPNIMIAVSSLRAYITTNYGETWSELRPKGDTNANWTLCAI